MYGDDHKIKSRYYIFPVVLVSVWLVRKLNKRNLRAINRNYLFPQCVCFSIENFDFFIFSEEGVNNSVM